MQKLIILFLSVGLINAQTNVYANSMTIFSNIGGTVTNDNVSSVNSNNSDSNNSDSNNSVPSNIKTVSPEDFIELKNNGNLQAWLVGGFLGITTIALTGLIGKTLYDNQKNIFLGNLDQPIILGNSVKAELIKVILSYDKAYQGNDPNGKIAKKLASNVLENLTLKTLFAYTDFKNSYSFNLLNDASFISTVRDKELLEFIKQISDDNITKNYLEKMLNSIDDLVDFNSQMKKNMLSIRIREYDAINIASKNSQINFDYFFNNSEFQMKDYYKILNFLKENISIIEGQLSDQKALPNEEIKNLNTLEIAQNVANEIGNFDKNKSIYQLISKEVDVYNNRTEKLISNSIKRYGQPVTQNDLIRKDDPVFTNLVTNLVNNLNGLEHERMGDNAFLGFDLTPSYLRDTSVIIDKILKNLLIDNGLNLNNNQSEINPDFINPDGSISPRKVLKTSINDKLGKSETASSYANPVAENHSINPSSSNSFIYQNDLSKGFIEYSGNDKDIKYIGKE